MGWEPIIRWIRGRSAPVPPALLCFLTAVPQEVRAATPATGPVLIARNEGILQIVAHADPIVKFVMLVLLAASVATWSIWIAKVRQLRLAKDRLRSDIVLLAKAGTLTQASAVGYRGAREMVEIATTELARAGAVPSHRALEGVGERVGVQLPIAEARSIHRVLWGTNVLASIGAISPFVGLAGTVWGIMNSFLSISQSHSTSLAVVAPGIAEALMATAIGLAAAIPAVLIYNGLARSIAGYRRLLGEVAVLTACVLSREVEQIDVDLRTGDRLRRDTVVPIASAPIEAGGR